MNFLSQRRQACLIVVALHLPVWAAPVHADPADYFKIQVVDEATGRGVPLVELQTTNAVRFYTDSNGIAALGEPGYFGQNVYFRVHSDGYAYEKDGFGNSGVALRVVPGGNAKLQIRRLNIAERLYRVTGEGIYRDSLLVGEKPPLAAPLLNGQVFGQDGVQAVPYRGRIFWCWGDTNQPAYPLGNFRMSGAWSDWPAPRGTGLDPAVGVDLTYLVNESGFSRPLVPEKTIPGPGAVWLGGLTTVPDDAGTERLIAQFIRLEGLGQEHEQGIVIYNDSTDSFDRLSSRSLPKDGAHWSTQLGGHPVHVEVSGTRYLYSGFAWPCSTRVRATLKYVNEPTAYEGFTCLVAGTRFDGAASRIDRRADGSLNYSWKPDTPPLTPQQEQALVQAGTLNRDEQWYRLTDVDSGAPVVPHASSIYWNGYRQRWVMIVEQAGGTSPLGEIWYAEADTPVGPWAYAKKIVTHENYSFYNPTQQPFFDQEGGRLIYFEGTYCRDFSGNPIATPRYEYNQIMYRLALDDARLSLPAPVYRVRAADGSTTLALRDGVNALNAWDRIEQIAFCALAPDRARPGTVPVYVVPAKRGFRLSLVAAAPGDRPLCHILPAESESTTMPLADTWTCTVAGIPGAGNLQLHLEQSGTSITGTLAGRAIAKGTLQSAHLEFELTAEGRQVAFAGEWAGDRLHGTWRQTDGQTGTWSAEKTQPAAPLFEFQHADTQEYFYGTEAPANEPAWRRTDAALGRVWKNPSRLLPLDRHARAFKAS